MKIGIIGAMDEEVALLSENIESANKETIGNCEFTTGKMQGKDVVLLKSGIGKVAAALSTAVLLEKYKPDVIINAGSAGGFSKNLKVGDIVISSDVVHHDVDVTAFGYKFGQVPAMPETFVADEKLVELAVEGASKLTDVAFEKGLIGTGDIFIHTPEARAAIAQKFPNIMAGEMEAAAIAQVAHMFGTPFVVVRSLSDIAGDNSGVSFEEYLPKAAKNSAELIMYMVGNL